MIDKENINQAKSSAFYHHRAGRIGASQWHAACHTDPAQPSQSLIKTICYRDVLNFPSAATRHGCKHEELATVAIAEYEKQMKAKHNNFKAVKCGTFIKKDYPFLHATPDFICSYDCMTVVALGWVRLSVPTALMRKSLTLMSNVAMFTVILRVLKFST